MKKLLLSFTLFSLCIPALKAQILVFKTNEGDQSYSLQERKVCIAFEKEEVKLLDENHQSLQSCPFSNFSSISLVGLPNDLLQQNAESNKISFYQDLGTLYVDCPPALGGNSFQMHITSCTGSPIKTYDFHSTSNEQIQIPISDFPVGLYIATITGENIATPISFKFNKQ